MDILYVPIDKTKYCEWHTTLLGKLEIKKRPLTVSKLMGGLIMLISIMKTKKISIFLSLVVLTYFMVSHILHSKVDCDFIIEKRCKKSHFDIFFILTVS